MLLLMLIGVAWLAVGVITIALARGAADCAGTLALSDHADHIHVGRRPDQPPLP